MSPERSRKGGKAIGKTVNTPATDTPAALTPDVPATAAGRKYLLERVEEALEVLELLLGLVVEVLKDPEEVADEVPPGEVAPLVELRQVAGARHVRDRC